MVYSEDLKRKLCTSPSLCLPRQKLKDGMEEREGEGHEEGKMGSYSLDDTLHKDTKGPEVHSIHPSPPLFWNKRSCVENVEYSFTLCEYVSDWFNKEAGTGAMAQRLRALAAFQEALSSIPSIHVVTHNHL